VFRSHHWNRDGASALADESMPAKDLIGFYGGCRCATAALNRKACSSAIFRRMEQVHFTGHRRSGHTRTGFRRLSLVQRHCGGGSRGLDRTLRIDPEGVVVGAAWDSRSARQPTRHAWNADVYTSWGFAKKVSLYGRLGYTQSEPAPRLPERWRSATSPQP